jgi:hypothetical protein
VVGVKNEWRNTILLFSTTEEPLMTSVLV